MTLTWYGPSGTSSFEWLLPLRPILLRKPLPAFPALPKPSAALDEVSLMLAKSFELVPSRKLVDVEETRPRCCGPERPRVFEAAWRTGLGWRSADLLRLVELMR